MGTNALANGAAAKAVAANQSAAAATPSGTSQPGGRPTRVEVNGAGDVSTAAARNSGATSTDFMPLALIVLIIISCGLLGGHGARLIAEETPRPDGTPALSRGRYYALGFIAAACVPLFLSLVQSSLITEILSKKAGEWLEALLIVAGLCLIAAVSARAFLDSLTKRVLRDLDRRVGNAEDISDAAQSQADAAAAQANAAVLKVETVTEIIDEQESQPLEHSESALESFPGKRVAMPLDDAQRGVLAAVASKTFRTVGAVAEESGLPREQVQEVLGELENFGLVEPSLSPRTGSPRWTATANGIATLYAA